MGLQKAKTNQCAGHEPEDRQGILARDKHRNLRSLTIPKIPKVPWEKQGMSYYALAL